MLKGISLSQLPTGARNAGDLPKLTVEFMCPRLHFSLPKET